jgi:hypothetical protein
MASTLGGDDPFYDLSPEEKDKKERELRKVGKQLRLDGQEAEGKKKERRANEISRRKSKRAHQ